MLSIRASRGNLDMEAVVPIALITGGHAGIGFEAAKRLASHAHFDLILAGRSPERIEPKARYLRSTYGVAVDFLPLDVSSLASVRKAAAICVSHLGKAGVLQALLCNAGVQNVGVPSYSADGYEGTFATNCLGHFLLMQLLLDRIAENGRVVWTASGTHDPNTMDGKMVGAAASPDARALAFDGKEGRRPLSGGRRYSTSKLCTVLYAYELHRRLRRVGDTVASIAFDPGSIPETGLLRTLPKPVQWLSKTKAMKWGMTRLGVTAGSLDSSGVALSDLASNETFANGSGKYFQSTSGRLIEARSSKVSYNESLASKLWDDSMALVHLKSDEEPRRFL